MSASDPSITVGNSLDPGAAGQARYVVTLATDFGTFRIDPTAVPQLIAELARQSAEVSAFNEMVRRPEPAPAEGAGLKWRRQGTSDYIADTLQGLARVRLDEGRWVAELDGRTVGFAPKKRQVQELIQAELDGTRREEG